MPLKLVCKSYEFKIVYILTYILRIPNAYLFPVSEKKYNNVVHCGYQTL